MVPSNLYVRQSFDESMQYAMLGNENSIPFRIYLRCFLFTNYCYLDSSLVSNFTKKQFIFLLSLSLSWASQEHCFQLSRASPWGNYFVWLGEEKSSFSIRVINCRLSSRALIVIDGSLSVWKIHCNLAGLRITSCGKRTIQEIRVIIKL